MLLWYNKNMNNIISHYRNVNSGSTPVVSGKVKKVDFHIHSHASSDAKLSIPQILKMSKNAGVGMISITDHNTQTGVTSFLTPEQKKEYGAYVTMPNGVKVVPGMEVTCKHTLKNGERVTLHLLIYAPKKLDDSVIGKLVELKNQHDCDADVGLIDYINAETPYQITDKMVEDYIKNKKISNPQFRRIYVDDIASMLIKSGQIVSRQQFLTSYSHNYSKAQVDYISLELEDVVKLAKKAGALTVIAHPAVSLSGSRSWKPFIKEVVAMGVDGVEAEYYHTKNVNADAFTRLFVAEKQHKNQQPILSGGTDAHNTERVLGKVKGKPLLETEFSLVRAIEDLHTQRVKEKEAFKLLATEKNTSVAAQPSGNAHVNTVVIKKEIKNISLANHSLLDKHVSAISQINVDAALGIDIIKKYTGLSDDLKNKVYTQRENAKKARDSKKT